MWWLLPVEFLAKLGLTYGLQAVESKFPGSASVINGIISFLEGAPAPGVATAQVVEHWSTFQPPQSPATAPATSAPAPQ